VRSPSTGRFLMFNTLDLTRYNNMDTAMKSLSVISKGVQELASGAADYSKKSLEQGTEALEKMLASRSLEKAMEIQSDYIKTAYESFIAESNRVSELCADVAKEVYKPFEAYVGKMPALPFAQASS
jgi:phasin family protein